LKKYSLTLKAALRKFQMPMLSRTSLTLRAFGTANFDSKAFAFFISIYLGILPKAFMSSKAFAKLPNTAIGF